MRLYIVESLDGEWTIWRSTPLKEALRRIPRVKKGMIQLGGKFYSVDPHRFRRMKYRPKRYLGLVTEYMQIGLWLENNPEPVDLFSEEIGSDHVSGAMIAELARSERLRRLVNPSTDWASVVLFFSILSNIILVIMLFYSVPR